MEHSLKAECPFNDAATVLEIVLLHRGYEPLLLRHLTHIESD